MPIERLMDVAAPPIESEALYEQIVFPLPPDERPYVFINMASTVDGKIVVGPVGGTAAGVGGPTDQLLFRRLQRNADAALIGAATLRASQVIYPSTAARFVATRTGNVPLDNRFFRDAPDRAYVIVPEDLDPATRQRIESVARLITAGRIEVDWPEAMRRIRHEAGVRTLLCEGGSQINSQLVHSGLVDELFLTLAPKLKGGVSLPTILGGQEFPPRTALPLTLLSVYRDGDELYLRYRLDAKPQTFERVRPAR
jgi:riboflavin biosynthesis pyrimidine reductase